MRSRTNPKDTKPMIVINKKYLNTQQRKESKQ